MVLKHPSNVSANPYSSKELLLLYQHLTLSILYYSKVALTNDRRIDLLYALLLGKGESLLYDLIVHIRWMAGS